MATGSIRGVRIAGMASAVPANRRSVHDLDETFGAEEVNKICRSTGVQYRHVVDKLRCSDLCYAAAQKLIGDLKWDPSTIDGLILVTQCPDFPFIPATSCVLHSRLGLSKNCIAFDVTLGCSGHIYGLWQAASLIAAGGLSRVLVLAGDISTVYCSPLDRSTALIFGDAGSATALERDASASPMAFSLGTDGAGGWKNLIMRASNIRSGRFLSNDETKHRKPAEGGNVRSDEDLFMDGSEIFAFTLREVAPLVDSVLGVAGWTKEDVDAFVFHQANKFMLTHLAKSMKLPLEKVPLSLQEYGNTSSASIPVTINFQLGDSLANKSMKVLMAGFGVGFSWAACAAECGPMVVPPIILVEESEAWRC